MQRFLFFFINLILLSPRSYAQPYKGHTLKVLSFRDNHSQAVSKSVADFEQQTGAKVIFDMIATSAVVSKINTDQLAGGTYDLYTVDEPFVPMLSSFLEPVEQWPDTEFRSIPNSLKRTLNKAIESASYNRRTYGVPVSANVYMYVFRKDLISDPKERESFVSHYGYPLRAPSNMSEMRDVAEFFYRPPKMYGFAPFTKKSEGTTIEAIWILGSFGTQFFDSNLNYVYNIKKAETAFRFYKDLMKFSPRGSKSWHHAERMASYSKGKIVQIMTWPSFVKGLEDPNYSLVAKKNAYTSSPHSEDGWPSAVTGTWSAAISRTSQNKKLAAEFVAWWTEFDNAKKLVRQGMNPASEDLLTDSELASNNPWFSGILKNFKHSVVRPRHPSYKMISDRISFHFTNMVADIESPNHAARAIDADIRKIMRESK